MISPSKTFCNIKEHTLKRADLSRKGSIDEPIRELVDIINSNPYYYTSSTCSGRITLIEKPLDNSGAKKGNKFLLNSHEQVDYDNFSQVVVAFNSSNSESDCLWLKFEPFILHVQCSDLDRARSLLNIALGCGNRNSGITLGKSDKFMVSVRSTSSMEVPIAGKFNLEETYLKFVWSESNKRLVINSQKLVKFQQAISESLRT